MIATGTPVDQTNSPEPVKIRLTVTKGDGQDTDNKKLASEDVEKAVSYLTDLHQEKGYQYGDEWVVYALLRSGQTIDQDKLNAYYESVCATVKGWSADQKPTDIERVSLALTAMGKDITNVDGVNLAAMIYNSEKLKNGSNELIYALIALDAADIQIPGNAKWNLLLPSSGHLENSRIRQPVESDLPMQKEEALILQPWRFRPLLSTETIIQTAKKYFRQSTHLTWQMPWEMISDMVPVKVQPRFFWH